MDWRAFRSISLTRPDRRAL